MLEKQTRGADTLGHSSVQPWSAGEFFPAIIHRIDRHTQDGEFQYSMWRLIYNGREAIYGFREAAELVARALISREDVRRSWNARRPQS